MLMVMSTSRPSATSPAAAPATIGAGEFKARCLELMDHVAATGEALVITKRGKPVARLVQIQTERPSLIGFSPGAVEWMGDLVSPVSEPWHPGDLALFDLTDPKKPASARGKKAGARKQTR